jgi:hypothetical protein
VLHFQASLESVVATTVSGSPINSFEMEGETVDNEFRPSIWTSLLEHAGQPIPSALCEPLASQLWEHVWHFHLNFLFVPEIILDGLPISSLANSGCVVAIEFLPSM